MSLVSPRVTIALISLASASFAIVGARFDRRVVDTVEAGNAVSEANHGYVGSDDSTGVFGGNPFRQARGFMRYAMTTFDDTEVTVACTFVLTDGSSRSYEVVVEDSVIAKRTFPAPNLAATAALTVVEIPVPFVLTKGKTNIAVVVRADGGRTPALQLLRTMQNHNEL
ncbi:MAG: DUF6805 domain-containing protein [Gemmatimonadaceae bacterium]